MMCSSAALADPAAQAKQVVDRYRAAAGLGEVTVAAELSAGCMKHAEYLRLNQGKAAIAGLAAHQEHPDLPGATPEGAACGKAADLFVGVSDVTSAIDGFMAGIYHRRPILDPALTKIGVGYTKLPDGNYIIALRFGETDGKSGTWPVRYPADDQHDVPLALGGEIPNPAPGSAAGYPITLQFPPFDPVTKVHATLTDAHGHAVPFYLSDPEQPATSFPQLGIVSVIARHPLAPATTYRVAIDATWHGKHATWKWQLTTLSLHPVDAADRAAMKAALGVDSLVHGKVTYAGTIDGADTVFLQLGKGDPVVSVIVPIAQWRELAGRADPMRWVGRTVEVQATPQLVRGSFINLAISVADQLRTAAQ
jgi:hypothetical protein